MEDPSSTILDYPAPVYLYRAPIFLGNSWIAPRTFGTLPARSSPSNIPSLATNTQ
jgi:hypothetical protein